METAVNRVESKVEAERPKASVRRRDHKRVLAAAGIQVAAVGVGLLVGAGLIAGAGANPIVAYKAVFVGAFGNIYNFTETLVKATPILLAGLGVTVAFRCR